MSLENVEIILVEPIYPGNIGAIARSAFNYDLSTIKIIGHVDYLCTEAKQMSLYGYPLLQKAARFDTLAQAVKDCDLVIGTVQQERYNRQPPLSASQTMSAYKNRILTGRTALVFGREDNGLTREEIDVCHVLTTLPTPTGLSFNLAHSATVFLYEMHRAINGVTPYREPPAPPQSEYEDLFRVIRSALFKVGFFRPDRKVNTMIRIRDVIYRMNLNSSDFPLLKAIFFKIDSFASRAFPHLPRDLFDDCTIYGQEVELPEPPSPPSDINHLSGYR
ncbi:hypothetical protein JW823_00255 [bacterium]|nr:hypothetical protein [candidate division CSSED10-310 bacterium]